MKFVLFAIVLISACFAANAFLVAGLGWTYFPSSAVGVAFYEHSNWLVFIHVIVGLVALCCRPFLDNQKTIAVVGIAFFSSILIHVGAQSFHSEKEINVRIDSYFYRVSSLELPTIDIPRPYGPSPFKPHTGVQGQGPNERTQSLYYSPKKQYGYASAFNLDENKKFFVAIHSSENDKVDRDNDSMLIIHGDRTLEFYPHQRFVDPNDVKRFHNFIQENLVKITEDIEAKVVSTAL